MLRPDNNRYKLLEALQSAEAAYHYMKVVVNGNVTEFLYVPGQQEDRHGLFRRILTHSKTLGGCIARSDWQICAIYPSQALEVDIFRAAQELGLLGSHVTAFSRASATG